MSAQAEAMIAAEPAAGRRIWLCADDYGLAPGVDNAIRELILTGRLNATSVMVVTPTFTRSEALSLSMLNIVAKRAAIGLHLTLTAPLRPLTSGFQPLADGAFLPVSEMLRRAMRRQLDRKPIAAEVAAQITAFETTFGQPPDFVDGHQHVHLFPQVRDAVLATVKDMAPNAWVRQCGSVAPLHRRLLDSKAILLDHLSRGFRRRARKLGVATNTAFSGTYDYNSKKPFAKRFPAFLDRLPDGGLVMCHPGVVDAELQRLDPLTTLREEEFAYFKGVEFLHALEAKGLTLAKLKTPPKAPQEQPAAPVESPAGEPQADATA